jgi:hypothetical protein
MSMDRNVNFQVFLLPNTTRNIPSLVLDYINEKKESLIITDDKQIFNIRCQDAETIEYGNSDGISNGI